MNIFITNENLKSISMLSLTLLCLKEDHISNKKGVVFEHGKFGLGTQFIELV